ncbi:MAG: Ig-like domain-containing protein [Bacteroidota bacterium]
MALLSLPILSFYPVDDKSADFPPVWNSTVVTSQVSQSNDDAEEDLSDGYVDLNSSDLELVEDNYAQIVGMRFQNITIPQGATIRSAYIEFECDESSNGGGDDDDGGGIATSLVIRGEDIDDASSFTTATSNISNRPQTAAFTRWNYLAEWSVNNKYQTPDLSTIIYEITSRNGWSNGNSIVLFVEGYGRRIAEAWDGEAANAPRLVIEYEDVPDPEGLFEACSCDGNQLENSTFETSATTNWTVKSQATVNYAQNLSFCGSTSLQIRRTNGASTLSQAMTQQEATVTPNDLYTLSFEAGVYDPASDSKVYIRFYSSGGSLLSENFIDVNHDIDQDDLLQSYSLLAVAPAASNYVQVEIDVDGEWLVLDNICLVNGACSAPTYTFENPTHLSGAYGAVGSTYEFSNVYSGVDVIATIESTSHSDISVESIDEPAATNGGYDYAFQPIVDYKMLNNNGSLDPAGDRSVTFRFDFVDASTGELRTIPDLKMTAVDVDGNSVNIREFIEASGFIAYETQSPTELTLSSSLKALGPITNYDGVDETALTTMVSFDLSNTSSLYVTYGANFDGSGSVVDSDHRLNCLFFKCYDFNTSVACPSVTVSSPTEICEGGAITMTASPSGGNGTCGLQWQRSYNNATWTNISGATDVTFTTTPTTNTYYRASYNCSGNTDCGTVFSDVAHVTVNTGCVEICTNGIDDDFDGLIDCDDPDCGGIVTAVTNNVTVCSGSSATFSVAASGNAPFTYGWDNGLDSVTSHTVTPLATTTYNVTVTNENNCVATDAVTVTVNQNPIANASNNLSICQNLTGQISASALGGTTPYQFSWDNGLGNGESHSVSPLTTTTYTVTVTSNNGCNDTDQVTVNVQTCVEDCSNGIDDDGDGLTDCDDPECGPIVDVGTDLNNCPGEDISIGASASGGNGPLTYLWSNGFIGQSQTVNPLTTATYSVTVTAPSGCTAVDQLVINVITCGEDCTNGIDDDGDGLVDCDDPDCTAIAAPMLVDDVYSTCPSLPFSERVTYNDENLQSPFYSIYANPTDGVATIDQTGKFTYTPNNTNCMVDQFVYQVCNQTTGCCSQATVTMNLGDVTSPTLINVPADVTISCDDAVPMPPNITAFDECPGIYMDFDETSSQHFAGACESYTITRTWVATDLCGNQASEIQEITIVDNAKPEIFQMYTLENGKRVIAGISKNVTHDWKYVPFPITFSETPMIFTTVITNNEMTAVTARQRNAYSQGFEIRLFEQESSDDFHAGEDVAWFAIESGTNDEMLKLEAGRWKNIGDVSVTASFSSLFGDDPGMITSMQSTNDTDPSTVRINSLTDANVNLYVQEETSADGETSHGLEHIGYLAFAHGEDLTDSRGKVFGETGKMNLTNAWATVSLNTNYTKPVVIFGGISNNDSEPVNVRVRNVTNNSFEVRLQEWDYLDGNHSPEEVSFIIVEGAIPGDLEYYCSGSASDLQVGVNVFAIDNCDDQTAFGYTETPSTTGNGTLTMRTWMAIDDCGNTNLISRYDTCSTAALTVRAILHGATMNAGNSGLMRDDLRNEELIPLEEPFSSLPAFPNVEDTTPNGVGGTNGGNDDNGTTDGIPDGYVLICQMPGTPNEQTILVSESSLDEHLAQGDVLGGCSGETEPGSPAGTESADYRTISDGNWSDANTWEGGNIPPTNNVNNRTISIEHYVTLQSGDLYMKNWSTLWMTNGGLTINSGSLKNDKSLFIVTNSELTVNGSFEMNKSDAEIIINNSTVFVSSSFSSVGKRWLENVCLTVQGNYENEGDDNLIQTSVLLDSNFQNKAGATCHLEFCKFNLTNGSFQNSSNAEITGDSLLFWVQNGGLENDGSWDAPIYQYCVSGSSSGLGGDLPISEDCSGMADYFNKCDALIDLAPINPVEEEGESEQTISPAEIALDGTLDPILLTIEGDDAIVDWMLLEIRDPESAEILEYATVAMERDGDIVSEDGEEIINFPSLIEGDYLVSIRHRNHLPIVLDVPMFLSILNPPLVDFTDPGIPVRGGDVGGNESSGVRKAWGGDFNGDDQVIYQGPDNDVFYLFSRVLSDVGNTDFLANYIVADYDQHDFNLDGKVIYQGPNNDRASLLYFTVLAHAGNSNFLANYIVKGELP